MDRWARTTGRQCPASMFRARFPEPLSRPRPGVDKYTCLLYSTFPQKPKIRFYFYNQIVTFTELTE